MWILGACRPPGTVYREWYIPEEDRSESETTDPRKIKTIQNHIEIFKKY